MPTYIPVPIETEPAELAQESFDYIAERVPGWLPAEGNLEAWLIEALAQIAGELRRLVAFVPEAIFEFFGESILGLPPEAATSATAMTTWTMANTAGYTIHGGTVVAITPPASTDRYAFQVTADFQVPAGQTVRAGVECRALEPGLAASGLTGTVEVIDALSFVATVTLDAPTSGGADAETADAYMDRLSALLTLLSPRPILPQDFAMLVQRTIDGVARATYVDLYNPNTGMTNVPRCVTVGVVDEAGNPVPAAVKQAADDLLQSQREVNFLAFIADPTYTNVDVTVAVKMYAGWDTVDVAARVRAALQSYLSPAMWGLPTFGDTSGQSWLNVTVVRYTELVTVVNNVDGVSYIVSLTLGKNGGAQSTADVTLTGTFPLPKPGAIVSSAT